MKTFKLENESKIASGFKTPDHYFENFSVKMMEQLPASEPKVISILQKRKNLVFMVAAVVIIALMVPILNYSSASKSELDITDVEYYITYQSNVNQYDLIRILETEDINSMNTSLTIADETIEDVLSENSNLENLILE